MTASAVMSFSKTRTRIELADISLLSDNCVIVQFHSLVDWQECQTTETIVDIHPVKAKFHYTGPPDKANNSFIAFSPYLLK